MWYNMLKEVNKMTTIKTVKTRFIQKHDTETNWLKATNFTPLEGEIIIYDIDYTYDYPRIKIGDGATNVNNLPFITGVITNSEIDSICGTTIVSGDEVEL